MAGVTEYKTKPNRISLSRKTERSEVMNKLNLLMQKQPFGADWCSNWCWAATVSSVSIFFNSGSPWIQCRLAKAALGVTSHDCCPYTRNDSECDKGQWLDIALRTTGNYRSHANGAGTMAEIRNAIDGRHPVCAHINWNGGGAHACAVIGYNADVNNVYVVDPYYNDSDIPLNAFTNSYQSAGTWGLRYFTQP